MNIFLFLLLTFIMGFAAAIPVGATQIEIAKRSLNNHRRAAFMVVAGSVCSDVMYGCIALFGVAPFLKSKIVIAIFGLAATLILWALAYLTFRDSKKPDISETDQSVLKSNKLSFITGFSLAVTNPVMIFWWLIGTRIIKEFGLVPDFNINNSLLFLISGGLGIAAYLSTLTNILHWARKFISNKLSKKVNYGLGIVLILLSCYFLFSSLRTLLN